MKNKKEETKNPRGIFLLRFLNHDIFISLETNNKRKTKIYENKKY